MGVTEIPERNPAPDMTTRNSRPSETDHASFTGKGRATIVLRGSALQAASSVPLFRDSDEAIRPILSARSLRDRRAFRSLRLHSLCEIDCAIDGRFSQPCDGIAQIKLNWGLINECLDEKPLL